MHNIVLNDRQVKVCEIVSGRGHIGRKGVKCLVRIRNAKDLHKVGAAFAECRLKTNKQTTFAAMFGEIKEGSDRLCAAICHHG